jgi:hypothetical protein
MHTNAGLIQSSEAKQEARVFEPLNSGPGGWSGKRQELEKRFAKAQEDQEEKNKYWREEAAKNEKIIDESISVVGDFVPK